MAGLIVLREKITAEVAGDVAPHAMDVIRVVLRVVVLHEEIRSGDAVIMRVPAFFAACPYEVQVGSGFFARSWRA